MGPTHFHYLTSFFIPQHIHVHVHVIKWLFMEKIGALPSEKFLVKYIHMYSSIEQEKKTCSLMYDMLKIGHFNVKVTAVKVEWWQALKLILKKTSLKHFKLILQWFLYNVHTCTCKCS